MIILVVIVLTAIFENAFFYPFWVSVHTEMAFSNTAIEAGSFLENAVLLLSCGGRESMYLVLWGSRGGILLIFFRLQHFIPPLFVFNLFCKLARDFLQKNFHFYVKECPGYSRVN